MADVIINGVQFRDMACAGAALLEKNRAKIDALNVFPVPDGDTGTNMCMTMESAVRELQKLKEVPTVSEVADALSMGALRGARGNSGVILSQLFRGFSKALKGLENMDAESFSNAVIKGSQAAYKAVMRPKEGTILTVSKAMADHVAEEVQAGANVYRLLDAAVEAGEIALAKTPEQLPVLKEAGVVDSGGKGLVTIYRGFKMCLDGEEITDESEHETQAEPEAIPAEERFGYLLSFDIIHLNKAFPAKELQNYRKHLEKICGDIVSEVLGDKIHVEAYTDAPGKVLQMALRYGEIDALTLKNIHEAKRTAATERKQNEKEFAVISVSTGAGIDAAFKELGVDYIISGGQTMNPSIDSISSAIYSVNARNVIILPNNSNIILAAQQAAKISEANVIVLPTKTIPQGFAALLAFDPAASASENEENMKAAFASIVSGAVTYAVRDTTYSGHAIRKGNILGMINNELTVVRESVEEAAEELIGKMMEKFGPDPCSLTLYFGEDVTEEQAGAFSQKLSGIYPEVDCIVQPGGQSLYYYYLSVE